VDTTVLVFFVIGFVLLTFGADLLVQGASNLAEELGLSRLVVGLTIVAFGTSAPELAVNLQSVWADQPHSHLAVGNVVGSNILNILLVLGIGALIVPLGIHKRLIRVEIPLMIGVSVLLLLLSRDGALNHWDGLLLASGIVFYSIYSIKTCRQPDSDDQTVCPQEEEKDNAPKYNITKDLFLIIVGLGLLVLGSQWLVKGAVDIAKYFGISELIIGLTIVSVGTSLPELATVVVGCLRNERDLVVGNLVGSNLFNILLVLGFTSLIAPTAIDVPPQALVFDMPVMIAVAVICFPIFFTGYLIERWEGGLFVFFYIAYALYLFLNATQHAWLPAYSAAMLWGVIPLTVIMLLVLVWRDKQTSAKKQ
jgi:cation:H+ antiporter